MRQNLVGSFKNLIRFFLSIPKFQKKNIKVKFDSFIDTSSILGGYNLLSSKVRILNSIIGFGTYIGYRSSFDSVIIGKFSSIGANVQVIKGRHPTSLFVSTHPAFFSLSKQSGFTFTKKQLFNEHKLLDNKWSIIVGNDVWIGSEVNILEGVKIGDGSIIAAGSLVTKDVPPYSIVGGNPCKIIRYRFNESEILSLLNFQWWNKDIEWLKENHSYFSDIKIFYHLFGNEVNQH